MGLILDILNAQTPKEKDREQELIEKGEYSPYNFEEEDLEEDDYYYEDED